MESKEFIIDNCPHCQLDIIIFRNEINCSIFRHGIYKKTGNQIDPHLNKDECDKLASKGKIYGCGKPFRLNEFGRLEKCDYI